MIKIFVIYRIGLDDESRIIAAYKYKDDAIAAQNRFKFNHFYLSSLRLQ